MHRDDISRLYKYLGVSAHSYLDFQTEENFRRRIDSLLRLRERGAKAVGDSNTARSKRSDHPSKVVAVISMGHLPGRKLVSSLAWMAAQSGAGKRPVRVVDLIPFEGQQEEKVFLLANGVKHILLNTSEQVVRMELVKDIGWIGREILDDEAGLVIVDVPERVVHVRQQVLAIADVLIVLVPATVAALRAIEEIEQEIADILPFELRNSTRYLLVNTETSESLPPLLMEELLSREPLFVPFTIQREAIPSAYELSIAGQKDSKEYVSIDRLLSFVTGSVAS